jgi:hypothetical protein
MAGQCSPLNRAFAGPGATVFGHEHCGRVTDQWRWVGLCTGWILKDEKPADIPVQEGHKTESDGGVPT